MNAFSRDALLVLQASTIGAVLYGCILQLIAAVRSGRSKLTVLGYALLLGSTVFLLLYLGSSSEVHRLVFSGVAFLLATPGLIVLLLRRRTYI